MTAERLSEYCLNCILEKQKKLIQSIEDENLRELYREDMERTIAQRERTDCAPVLVAKLTANYEKYFGTTDIYKEIKEKYNRLMMSLADEIRSKIEASANPLAQALVFARAGNFIDFGAMHDVDDTMMYRLLKEAEHLQPQEDALNRFQDELAHAKKLVYLTDNCGEIVLDRLFVEQIQKQYPELAVTVIVRGAPVINDATMADAEMVGLTEMQGILVMDNGTAVAGTELSLISPDVLSEIQAADVIISKGQGNFETLHGCGLNIFYLFLCKCDWFSMNLGLPKYSGVFENERMLVTKNDRNHTSGENGCEMHI